MAYIIHKSNRQHLSPSISPENKQLISNVGAWMRCKADLVHGWTIQPFTFTSIALFEETAR
jgi:hypothetical protein